MFRWITGELIDRQQEQAYLAAAWPQTRVMAGIVFGLTTMIISGLIYLNLTVQNFDPDLLYMLVPLRVLQTACYAFVFLICLRNARPAAYPYAIMATQVATLFAEVGNNALAVLPYATGDTPPMPFIIVILLTYYTLIPARFSYTILFGVITSVVYCVTAWMYFSTTGYLMLMFAFVNVVGISYGRFVNRLQRQEFLSRLEIERAENEAQAAKQVAEAASAEKSRFIAVASHDLRQPLHAMGLWIDTLGDQIRNGQTSALTDTVSHLTVAKDSLDGLLDRLLHASHLDSGTTVLKPETLAVEQVLLGLEARFGESAKQKNITLHVRSQSLHGVSDAVLLARILDNLTDNAIKYSLAGGRVLVGVRRGPGAESLRVQVWNTGEQIPPAEQERIFEEFHQAARRAPGDYRGLGLGLSIVKRLCQLLEHQIRARSHATGVTMFEITLAAATPDTRAEPAEQKPLSRYEGQHLAVLVIDDDAEIRDAMHSLLSRWGMTVHLAADRAQAESQMVSHTPDLIITDQHLQQGDNGIDVARHLVACFNLDVPVLLMSGETATESLKQASESGYRLLTKPVKPAQLRMVISQLVAG